MRSIKTSKGWLEYNNQYLYLGDKKINPQVMIDDLKILSFYLDKIDICWGPAFGTLIGIVRNDDFIPWIPNFDVFILKEDEERFKDVLWLLKEEGFQLVRYERRGLYYLERKGEYFKIFVLRKISSEIRHTGGSDFVYEKYLQNTVKWDFKGVELNVPQELDEYLSFQYGNWIVPAQTKFYKRRKKNFGKFKQHCEKNGIPLPPDVELSYVKPRKHKKVLTVGVYDLIHKGHVELFRRAKGLGDYLIVAVQDGDLILKFKPQAKVLNSTEDRMYMVKSIRYVDEVIGYGEVNDIVKDVDFDVFVTGPDQIHTGFQDAIRWCEENGKAHVVLARTDGVSSSELKEMIAKKQRK